MSTTPPSPPAPTPTFSSNTDATTATPPLLALLRPAQGGTASGKWTLTPSGAALERTLHFKTFKAAWAFMQAAAAECARHRHHPEWANVYNRVFVRWTTHAPPGLSGKDLVMAGVCDEIALREGEVEGDEEDGGVLRGVADVVAAGAGDCCVPKGIAGDGAEENGASDCAKAKDHNLDGRSVFSSEAKGGRVLVVDLVDVLVERAPVQSTTWRGERRSDLPNLRELDGEVAQQDQLRASPLLLPGGYLLVLDLVLVQGGNAVDDHPGQRAAKVDNLVHDEGHDAGGKHVILHERIPGQPETLKDVQGDVVGGNFVVFAPVSFRASSTQEGAIAAAGLVRMPPDSSSDRRSGLRREGRGVPRHNIKAVEHGPFDSLAAAPNLGRRIVAGRRRCAGCLSIRAPKDFVLSAPLSPPRDAAEPRAWLVLVTRAAARPGGPTFPSSSDSDEQRASVLLLCEIRIMAFVQELQALITALSLTARAKPSNNLAPGLCSIVRQARSDSQVNISSVALEQDLEWVLLGKVAAQTYGLVLDALIQQTLPLNDEIWYWSDVAGSYHYTALYSIQTSPLRLWDFSKQIYGEVRQRKNVLAQGWSEFYGLVRTVVREKSVADLQRRAASPLALVRSNVQKKLAALEHAKSLNASGVGYLLSNCFDSESVPSDHWKAGIVKSISVMHSVLRSASDTTLSSDSFDDLASSQVDEDDLSEHVKPFFRSRKSTSLPALTISPMEVAPRLEEILEAHLQSFHSEALILLKRNGRPSRLIRYWLPASALLLSSSTILRILVNRKAEIIQWIREIGQTTIDFWQNWVVDPARKVIGTIRHDEGSEISIMSKSSLEGDRASLERMVVDFAVDNPEGAKLGQAEIDAIRVKIQEGDLTPVLRAYEKDMKSPFMGTVRGNLIRALLVQVQKTKVDIEVAMGGIDSLLKSQQLLFGLIGVTPGVLVCVGLWRYLGGFFTNRKESRRGRNQSQSFQVLRNIDRILTGSPQANDGMLSTKEFGLLVCEAIVLRGIASKTFPKQTFRGFLQDFTDLIDNSSGVGRQIRVADRIRWAYARWL
ncbi:hypothetical protein FH972_021860 [Carpinus fangiana]|uniref:4a-hydroxytetrahydrobiopterin dehydratase n=1 Tax=Carpinus fangiana TaxID=176857 RepID=A0A5N6KQW8_9ROSI|nr:hypothetical protein FH972_021860 [Carpinus fangiana]